MPEDIVSQTISVASPVSAAETSIPKKNKSKLLLFIFLILILVGVGGYLVYALKAKPVAQNITSQTKFCQGVKIVFFPGGNSLDSFASVVYNGAKAAETALGANVQYEWSGWDSSKMVEQFQDAMSTSPDAIAMMGHPGADTLGSLVDEAERKGIIVTMQNVDIPAIREKYTNNGFGYVGQALHASGLLVSNGVIQKYQPKAGAEAIVFGIDPKDVGRYERTQGIIDGLLAAKLLVHEVTITAAVQKDAKSLDAQKLFGDALAKYPDAKIIVIDHGPLTSTAAMILKTLGKKPGEYSVAGFDLSNDTTQGIIDDYIGLVQDQQPYLQGFLPILQACLSKKYGFAGLYIDTGVGLIDKTNINLVAGLARQGIR
jgi:simple sugar transport system substrate-binding protein